MQSGRPNRWNSRFLAGSNDRTLFEPLETRALLTVFVVDTPYDFVGLDGAVSLREAVLAANTDTATFEAPAGNGADEIRFAPGLADETIELNGIHLEITAPLTITGQQDGLTTRQKTEPQFCLLRLTPAGDQKR